MKKKRRFPRIGDNAPGEAVDETDYESLRSFVVEGIEIGEGIGRGLAVFIECGAAAWARQCRKGVGAVSESNARSHTEKKEAENDLAMLIANMIESAIAAASELADTRKQAQCAHNRSH